ncbi:MAG: hypothetical protein CL424_00385 [Acidimicrobiaceae bacterium]|nr:hypothetical protein [Acidimicrobiaceae bacterium]
MAPSTNDVERLFAEHRERIRAYCARRLSADLVDDAVAETFATAWRKRDRLPAGEAALPWLYGVASRVVQHAWRSAGRSARLRDRASAAFDGHAVDGAEQVVIDEDHRNALRAAALLGDDDQEILRLTLWEELSPTDAAAVLGISPDAAKQRASRARRRLGDAFRRLEATSERDRAAWARPTPLGKGAPS